MPLSQTQKMHCVTVQYKSVVSRRMDRTVGSEVQSKSDLSSIGTNSDLCLSGKLISDDYGGIKAGVIF